MATGEAELHIFQTTCDGRIVVSRDCCFACWPYSYLKFRLVLTFLLPQSWSIHVSRSCGQFMGVDVRLYTCTSLLSAQCDMT